MNIKKIITGLALSIMLSSGVAVSADLDKGHQAFNSGLQAYNSGDYTTALAEWTPLAEQGNANAQYSLGILYRYGRGVPENDKTTVKWYTLAAI